jgi:hypothetical protein
MKIRSLRGNTCNKAAARLHPRPFSLDWTASKLYSDRG